MPQEDSLKSRLKTRYGKLFRRRHAALAAPSATSSIADNQPTEQGDTECGSKVPLTVASKSHPLPSPSVADPRITQPGMEAIPADQHQPTAVSQIPRPATSVESLPRSVPTEPSKPSNPASSVSEELWNAAYDDLEEAEAELVASYVKTLNIVLGGKTRESFTTDHLVEMKDPIQRQKNMRELVQRGQQRIEKASKIATKVGGVADFILSSKGIVDLTLQSVPQAAPAALPWAGVCLGLEILRNPAQATNSNLEGMVYVISRMDWYCALTKLLLDENSANRKKFQEILSQLKGRIIELYNALLQYQMKSIVSYYRNQGLRFLRDIVRWDDWEGDIKRVKDLEVIIQNNMNDHYREHTKTSLNKLVDQAHELTTQLGNIQQDIRSFMAQQNMASREKDESDCRRDLRVVDPQDDMQRIENNKDQLLDDAYKWIFNTSEHRAFSNWENDASKSPRRRVLWLKGHAGTGKTMLMIGLIRQFSSQSAALAPGVSFFFCQGTDVKLKNATAVLRSLIWLLLLQQPHLILHLLPRYKDSGASLFTDQNSFVALSDVFKNMLRDDGLSPVYFAVDALDECSEDRDKLIALISTTVTLSENVRWLLSSRPEVDVLAELKTPEALVELNTQRLEDPVKAYIKHKLSILKGKNGYRDEILDELSDIVHQRAGNTFLWVALAFKALGKKHGEYAIGIISAMPPKLSDLYKHMMTRIEESERVEPEDCKKVLKATFLAFRPLSLSELSLLADLKLNMTKDIVEECGSFVIMTGETVNLIHQSAKDYLQGEYAARLDLAGVVQGHTDLIERSLDAISSLEQNLYGLDLGIRPVNMKPPNPDPLAPLRYSCVSWIDHLRFLNKEKSEFLESLLDNVRKFLEIGFLRWVESLSLLGKVEDGLLSMKELTRLVQARAGVESGFIEFLNDAYRFILNCRYIIEQAPLQTYGSALVFSPTWSRVRKHYWDERLPLVDRLLSFEHVNDHYQTLEGHTKRVTSVAFSPDCKTLASASIDGTIRLWDTAIGAPRQTFEDSETEVNSMAFSPDGRTLASGLYDSEIQLWDVATGVCQQTLEGHTSWVSAVAFSPDGNTLASASGDNNVRLWDMTSTPPNRKTFEGHTGWLRGVAFSPDGNVLASSSDDGTIRLWEAATGVHRQTLEYQDGKLRAVAFSPDGNALVLGSYDGTIKFRKAATDGTLKGPECGFTAVAFSPDGNTLALGALEGGVVLWDVATAAQTQAFGEPDGEEVVALAFSPDGKTLASASDDTTVRLWDMTFTTPNCVPLNAHTGSVSAVAFSPDGKMLASASVDRTVRLWDMSATLPNSKALEEQNEKSLKTAISPNAKHLASISIYGTLRLWDITTSGLKSKITERYRELSLMATAILMFSPDSKMLVLAYDGDIWLWDLTAFPPKSRVICESWDLGKIQKVAFSPDGEVLEMTSREGVVQQWDLATNTRLTSHVRSSSQHNRNEYLGYGISHDGFWVTLNGRDLLWLPANYRSSGVFLHRGEAIRESTVAILNDYTGPIVLRFS